MTEAPQRPHWTNRLYRLLRRVPGCWPLPQALHDLVFLRPAAYWPFLHAQLAAESSYHGPVDQGLRILLINHNFDQDIEALLQANDRHRFLILRYQEIRELARMHFPKCCLEGLETYNLPEMEPFRRRYRGEIGRVVDSIRDRFPFDLAAAPSDLFFWIRELVPEIQERGIPFVVIDKEGATSPYGFHHHAEKVRTVNPFISDYLLAWSERAKEFWIRAGAPPELIHVIGQQRSDHWHRPEDWPDKTRLGLSLRGDAQLVLFLSFDRSAYIPKELYDAGVVRWDDLFEDTHRVTCEFARTHPECDVVIKAHPQQTGLKDLQRWVDSRRVANLRLATGAGLSNPLIGHADVVAGFQTTALIEAMIPGQKPIIYTFWSDAKRWADQILPFHTSGALTVVESPHEFRSALQSALTSPVVPQEQLEARSALVDATFHNPDGRVCQRTLQVLEEFAAFGRPRRETGPWPEAARVEESERRCVVEAPA
ncbi:MAG: hypothetical protein ACYSVY_09920 [Planctomycetota bacterium]|jgi:hypothetical protein